MAFEEIQAQGQATYDRKMGRYGIRRVYKCPNLKDYEAVSVGYGDLASSKIPGFIELSHFQAGDPTVRCYAGNRSAADYQHGNAARSAMLTVDYVGFVHLPIFWEQDVVTEGEQIIATLPDAAGTVVQIGMDAEGVTIERPRTRMRVYENVSGETLMEDNKMGLIEILAGSVNEANWTLSVKESNNQYEEGHWIYFGATSTHHPGGTFSLLHTFLSIPPVDLSDATRTPDLHNHKWRDFVTKSDVRTVNYVDSAQAAQSETVEVEKRYYEDPPQTGKVRPIAGTDTKVWSGHKALFADLGL